MTDMPTGRDRVLSGMRPTGKLHLGNYLGALANWVRLQPDYDCFYFVANWHVLTTDPTESGKAPAYTIEMAADWLGAGRFAEDAVHESVTVDGRVETLGEALLHQSYRDLEDFVRRSNRYSTLAARDWVQRGRRVSVPALVMKPLARFFSMYIVKRGFLDGWRGLVLAVLYAEYVFLRMAKAWEARRAPGPHGGL